MTTDNADNKANATFEERALDWHNRLTDADKEEIMRQAYQQFNVNRLQPKPKPTDAEIAQMDPQEFERYKRSLGI